MTISCDSFLFMLIEKIDILKLIFLFLIHERIKLISGMNSFFRFIYYITVEKKEFTRLVRISLCILVKIRFYNKDKTYYTINSKFMITQFNTNCFITSQIPNAYFRIMTTLKLFLYT
jgi:hypothetical protein